ncbi:hypothetical protein [Ancylobacter radicis]|uniref:Uncharacterized protein n=1 Tax=Ancylobacter radicis TaxID=2836179 RepID=A0ABS5R322_9HYPH|nr:hypothetical protein [Ancylobacter radicis]MBS9475625.1 hypothetical protein [Ancylobacter radicis]
MKMPIQSPAILRSPSFAPFNGAVHPAGCGFPENVICAAAVAACVAACAGGPGACIQCFAALGMSDCIECL